MKIQTEKCVWFIFYDHYNVFNVDIIATLFYNQSFTPFSETML